VSQAGAGLLLLLVTAPICLLCAYFGWTRGVVRLGIATHERDGEPLFFWWGMAVNAIGGMFSLITGWWLLFS